VTNTTPIFVDLLMPGVALTMAMHLQNLESVASSQKCSHDPYHAHFGGGLFTLGWDLPQSIHLSNLRSVVSSIPEILMGV